MVVTEVRTQVTVEFDESVVLTDEVRYSADSSRNQNQVKARYEVTGARVVTSTAWDDTDPVIYLQGWALRPNGQRDKRATATADIYSVGVSTYNADGSTDYDDADYRALVAKVLDEVKTLIDLKVPSLS
jgi:hypothetical protein